jgi:SnoaL-like domain
MPASPNAALSAGLRRLIDCWPPEPRAVADLFAADAVLRTSPYTETARGRREIIGVFSDLQSHLHEVRTWFGEPLWSGASVALERWTSAEHRGAPLTCAGVLLVRLAPDGRCRELREYWMRDGHRLVPYSGWSRFSGGDSAISMETIEPQKGAT